VLMRYRYFIDFSEYNAGLLTIAITMAPQVSWNLQQFAKSFTTVETQMNAVERVQQYSTMEQEPPEIIQSHRPPQNWPENGIIKFENVWFKYREDKPDVLRDLSFLLKKHEKVGIVGRTGAGKSSMMQTLFRMGEIYRGQIFIDDVDIQTLGLYDLRSKMSIIPQDPTMFIGTVRKNLDPFSEYSDADTWEALRLVNLDTYISSLPLKLEDDVQENGSNFSVGQRQLICMARALLRQTKILLMDEATASVDMETDKLIQKTIRSSFSGATLLVIAHRLNTVMDLDRIMVLEKGEIIEFDSPSVLANDPNSALFGMIEATGAASARHLTAIANGQVSVLEEIEVEEEEEVEEGDEAEVEEEADVGVGVRLDED